jgi:integrase
MEAGATWMKQYRAYKVKRKKTASDPIKQKSKIRDIQDYLQEKSERDYILFALGVGTGYRAGDLVSLQIRDVKEALDDGYFEILEGKKKNSKNIRKENMTPRRAYIMEKLDKALREYIKDKKDYEYMFPSRKGEHIGVQRVTVILSEAAKQFGLKKITAHSMRKTYAYTIWVAKNYNTTLVRDMLGHRSDQETRRYLGLDEETYKDCSQTLNDILI